MLGVWISCETKICIFIQEESTNKNHETLKLNKIHIFCSKSALTALFKRFRHAIYDLNKILAKWQPWHFWHTWIRSRQFSMTLELISGCVAAMVWRIWVSKSLLVVSSLISAFVFIQVQGKQPKGIRLRDLDGQAIVPFREINELPNLTRTKSMYAR